MAEWNQLGRLLGRGNTGDARDFERIPLRIQRESRQYVRRDAYERLRACRAFRFGLGGDVHHARGARGIEVRQPFHLRSTRMSSPAFHSIRPASATRNALARVSDGISPEPRQEMAVN